MNVFIPIDQSWSFKFLEFNKKAISQLDFFTFIDQFYNAAMQYVVTQVNFYYGMGADLFNQRISGAMQWSYDYPELAPKIQEAFRRLHMDYRVAYEALGSPISEAKPAVDHSGVLLGIVFTTVNRSY